MNVYRAKYRDKRTGRMKRCQKYRIDFTDNTDRRRRLTAFANKRESERAADKIQWLLSTDGRVVDPDLRRWVESIPSAMRKKLIEFGLIADSDAGKPLGEHLDDWRESILAKGRTPQHADLLHARVSRVLLDGCQYKTWSEISTHDVVLQLKELRVGRNGISNQTHNHHVQALRQFGKWMMRNKRASETPFDHLSKLNIAVDRRHDRRAMTDDEARRLVQTTAGDDMTRFGMTGPERSAVYRLGLECGLRAGEIRSLKAGSFDFDALTVKVEAAYAKGRREDVLPLRADTAALLKTLLASKTPDARAFAMPNKDKVTRMLRGDLEKAGVAYELDGKFADFHATRHTFLSNVVRSGATVKEAQTLARHAKPELTIGIYSHVGIHDRRAVVDRLPSMEIQQSEAVKTGTTDSADLSYTCQKRAQQCTSADHGGQTARPDHAMPKGQKTASKASKKPFSEGKRRGRDSNPRYQLIPVRRFSKPLP